MNRQFTTFGRTAAIFLTVSIVPILYAIWLHTNPALVHNLWQTDNTSSMQEPTQGELTPLGDGVLVMSLFEQISAVIGGFAIKPGAYGVVSGGHMGIEASKTKRYGSLALGIVCLLAGGSILRSQLPGFQPPIVLFSISPWYGMVVGFVSTFYAVFEAFDKRLIQFTAKSKKCAAFELCGKCIKAQPVPCGVRRIILLILPVMMMISMLPMVARFQAIRYQTEIIGTVYTYDWPLLYQLTEARLAPMLALFLFAGAWVAMFLDRRLPVPDSCIPCIGRIWVI